MDVKRLRIFLTYDKQKFVITAKLSIPIANFLKKAQRVYSECFPHENKTSFKKITLDGYTIPNHYILADVFENNSKAELHSSLISGPRETKESKSPSLDLSLIPEKPAKNVDLKNNQDNPPRHIHDDKLAKMTHDDKHVKFAQDEKKQIHEEKTKQEEKSKIDNPQAKPEEKRKNPRSDRKDPTQADPKKKPKIELKKPSTVPKKNELSSSSASSDSDEVILK